jgi:hypothetical protein
MSSNRKKSVRTLRKQTVYSLISYSNQLTLKLAFVELKVKHNILLTQSVNLFNMYSSINISGHILN